MAFPQIDIEAGGPLTAADLDRAIAAGNTGRALTFPDLENAIAAGNTGRIYNIPAGCDMQGRYKTRRWGQPRNDEREWRLQFEDTVPTQPGYEVCIENDASNDANPAISAAFWWLYIVLVVVAVIAGAAAFL